MLLVQTQSQMSDRCVGCCIHMLFYCKSPTACVIAAFLNIVLFGGAWYVYSVTAQPTMWGVLLERFSM